MCPGACCPDHTLRPHRQEVQLQITKARERLKSTHLAHGPGLFPRIHACYQVLNGSLHSCCLLKHTFKSLAPCWQHVTGGRHLDPLGTRKGNSTARPSSAKVVLADACPRSPSICPSRHPANPRLIQPRLVNTLIMKCHCATIILLSIFFNLRVFIKE